LLSGSYEIDDEALRLLVNLQQHYASWIEAERILLPGRLAWKTVGARDYLYCLVNGRGLGHSLGPRSAETEALFEQAQLARKTVDILWPTLGREGALYRTMRLPRVSSAAAELLREFDRQRLLGDSLMIVGTNAMAVYEVEARLRFATAAGVDTTQDVDMTWVAEVGRQTTLAALRAAPRTLLDVMKRVDATYTVNTERKFQVRNSSGYEVELLMPLSLEGTLPRTETIVPIALREQDWLLPGRRIEHVLCGLDGLPARVVVPDPRWFALQKLWLAEKPERNSLKKPKDAKQGELLLSAIKQRMPHYPMDDAFRAELPSELQPHFDRWRNLSRAH
jgi:hypothetical protein